METQSEYICPGLETPDYIRVDPGEAAKIYEAGDFIAKYAMEVCMASGSRFIKLPLDYNYEAYVFGSRIKHRSDGMVITQYRYESVDELSWLLTKTYEPKQFGAIFDAVKIASKNGTVMLRVEGVFSILSTLINPMKILRALKKKRALITRLMEHMTEILYQYMNQALQNGVSIISYADPVGTIELVGRNEYKKVIGKYTYILMKQLEPDLRQGLMHLCGKCSFALEKCGYLKMIPVPVKEMFYADAMYAGMAPLKKAMPVSAETGQHVIVIGSVFGDTHDIGKNIVALFLEGSGFKVINLGRDVAPEVFVDAAEKNNADIIVISTLMTTTMWGMKDVIEMLKVRGLRDRVKVMVGGKPLSINFAKKIGADGYSHDAKAAVALAKKLIYEDYSLQK